MGTYTDLKGTTAASLQIEKDGVKLKNNSAALEVMAADGTTPAPLTASILNATGASVVINSDATEASADWKYTFTSPAAGMTANVELTLPIDDGTASQVLQTDGAGVLSWQSAGTTEMCRKQDTTTLAHDTSSPLTLFTLPANAIVNEVRVIIDTAFTGTAPTLSAGIAGTVSKYLGATQNDLQGTAKDMYIANPGEVAVGTTETVIATYAADSAEAGSARIVVDYSVPA